MNPETETKVDVETSEHELIDLDFEVDNQDDIEALKEQARKATEYAKNQKIRAEKAEAKAKEVKTEKKPEVKSETTGLSERDVFALVKADIAEDDVDEVKSYAKYRGISVAEALKDSTLKHILSVKSEERKTAEVTNTKSPRGSARVTGESLLEKARSGETLPDSEDAIQKLVLARMGSKK